MNRQIELSAVQVASNDRIELLFVDLYQLMDRVRKCVQKAASFFAIDTARLSGVCDLRHGGTVTAIGIPKPTNPG
jgi:hypothetical protein